MCESDYYYINSFGEVYKVLKDNTDISIYLFKVSGIHNLKVVSDTLYFVSGDTISYYNPTSGIVEVVKNNELRYNTDNRQFTFV